MKNLIFLLVGFICFAKAQNADSLNLVQLKQQLEEKNNRLEVLIEKSDKVEKRHETMFHRLKVYISKLVDSQVKEANVVYNRNNREGIKTENPTDPVVELEEPDGVDSIRGGWLFRLFHKNNYYLKYYKNVGNEKIYLD